MFAVLSDAALARLDGHLYETVVDSGTAPIRENDNDRQVFILAEGFAEVRVRGVPVSSVAAREVVGEPSMLDTGPRSATVVALTPLRVFVLNPRQFAELFDDPRPARWIAANLARRLRAVDSPQRTDVVATTDRRTAQRSWGMAQRSWGIRHANPPTAPDHA